MKNTYKTKEELEHLPFNEDDIAILLTEMGYPPESVTRDKDSTRVLIDMGCNFVEEILDYIKMLKPQVVRPQHVQAAIKLKFGQDIETKVRCDKDIQRLKMRAIQLMKIDEKTNPNR